MDQFLFACLRAGTLLVVLTLAALPDFARAQDTGGIPNVPDQPGAAPERAAPAGGQNAGVPGFDGPIWERNNLLGDPLGVRSSLAAHGVTYGVEEQVEVLGNASGGVRQGAIFEGLLSLGLGLDTGKAGLWPGGTFNVTAFQIQGRGLSLNNLDNNLNTVSNFEAYRGALLFELWYEQALLDNKVSVRVGQLAADQEFQVSQYGGLFINHTFGWSTQPSTDLPSGGPAYPLAAPGARIRVNPVDNVSVLLGVFNGDPAGPGTNLPQLRDSSGTDFRLNDGVFVIGELQYRTNTEDNAPGLPGTFKIGGWYDSDRFHDLRTGPLGSSLASAQNQTGVLGRVRQGDYSLYAMADQMVWRKGGTKDEGIGVFARAMGGPGDRNLVNFYADAGFTWKGAIPGRDGDTLGLAYGYARISDTASLLDSEVRAITGGNYPIRRSESVLEATYQAQIAPWLAVQWTAQYLFDLNGDVPNPLQPGKRLGDAAVFGERTSVTF